MVKKWLMAGLSALCLQASAQDFYFQHADNATLINNAKGEYVLTITGLDSKTLGYSNGFKSSEKMSTEQFFDGWMKGKSPVAAVINMMTNKSLSFKLSKANYNMVKKSVEYRVDPLGDVDVSDVGKPWGDVIILIDKEN